MGEGVIRRIPVDQIDPNPWNGHRTADEGLVASVKASGVLQNLVVRPCGDRFQIVAGSRRCDAANRAGLVQVPAIVMDLDDQAARELTIVENLQRENLHPLEEAKAIAELQGMYDPQEVAARIGKTPAFVTRRAKLLKLTDQTLGIIEDHIHRIPIRVLELLAALPPGIQESMAEYADYMSVEDFQCRLARDQKTILGALWDPDDEALVPEAGACANCPKRTGFEPLLFEDLTELATHDCCLDDECYARKSEAHLARREAELREKNGEIVLVAEGMGYGEEAAELRKRGVVNLYGGPWEKGKKKDKGARMALVVKGHDAGKTLWLKPKIETAASSARDDDSGGGDQPVTPEASMAARRMKLDQRRYAWCAGRLTRMVNATDDAGEFQLPAEKYRNPEAMVRIAAAFGGGSMIPIEPGGEHTFNGDELAVWAQSAGVPVEKLFIRVWDAAGGALRRAMQVFKVSDIDQEFIDGLKLIADLVDQNWDQLWDEACAAIPEPKSWKKKGA